MNKPLFQTLLAGWKSSLVIFLLSLSVGSAVANIAVVPLAYANTGANTYDSAPLGAQTQHFQQLYSSSLLGLNVGDQITAIGFRLDNGQTSIPAQTVANYSISMGPSAVTPGNMTTNFSANRGAGFTSVLTGPLSIAAGQFPGGAGLNNFGYIQFTTPYTYTGGNLLIEISYSAFPKGGAKVDAAYPYNAALAQTAFGTVSSTTANKGLYKEAIVMAFQVAQVTPVPEPATFALLAIGLIGLPVTRFLFARNA